MDMNFSFIWKQMKDKKGKEFIFVEKANRVLYLQWCATLEPLNIHAPTATQLAIHCVGWCLAIVPSSIWTSRISPEIPTPALASKQKM